jgi:signal transduction histidine kinase
MKALKILVADDTPLNLKLLRAELTAQGHESVPAANGLEALAILGNQAIDAVISDILMPSMDGYRLCREIRGSATDYRNLPVILYTATYDSPGDRLLAESVGADAFILKPAPIAMLIDAVRTAIQTADVRRVSKDAETDVLKLYNAALVHKLESRNLEVQESLAELRGAHEQIVEANQLLETRVAQRTAELDAANKELEAFSFSVSHELQSPLRTIDGLAKKMRGPDSSRQSAGNLTGLDQIIDAAAHMTQLIDALLAFARTSRTEMHFCEVDLDSLVDRAIAALQVETAQRTIDWRRNALPKVHGDPILLYQVLVNLLSNAVKYTRTRAHAVIEVGARDGSHNEAIIFVRDNGVGFDQRYAGKLFGVFQRLHRTDEFEGTGIGLANAQRIITRHGGSIWADATLGGGACFHFSLTRQEGLSAVSLA